MKCFRSSLNSPTVLSVLSLQMADYRPFPGPLCPCRPSSHFILLWFSLFASSSTNRGLKAGQSSELRLAVLSPLQCNSVSPKTVRVFVVLKSLRLNFLRFGQSHYLISQKVINILKIKVDFQLICAVINSLVN